MIENTPMFPPFHGEICRMALVSNCLGYGPCPEEGDLVEQHLTLCSDGRVWFSRYEFGYQGKHRCVSTERFRVEPEKAGTMLSALAEYFSGEYQYCFVTDIGDWHMQLINTEGRKFAFAGPLTDTGDGFLARQSAILRQILSKPDAYLFDNDCFEPDTEDKEYGKL